MLKRIRDWQERADELCGEIYDVMPAQYREHKLMKGRHGDYEWPGLLRALEKHDPVAAAWLGAWHHAVMLGGELIVLDCEITDRAKRNGILLDQPQLENLAVTDPEKQGEPCEAGGG